MSRGDEVVRLEPKVMQVLVCLCETPGEVVTRETLIARVWPDVYVTDDVLHRAIRTLRRIFQDETASPAVIETGSSFSGGGSGQVANSVKAQGGVYAKLKSTHVSPLASGASTSR